MRAVFSVYAEPFTVIARTDSGIKTFEDLKGKKVNIGNPGSGNRATMNIVMEKMGWTADDFSVASELKASEHAACVM
ncbi:TAXI family TRAP transporter solute-binding subunit [Psychromonas sp. KJ10-10]|uniref:TAXI family TRAP transporter solute-binding subunit n=1 Tax=Psychromonas sp. KJ10-10 TaxID=3391823 RepID=UPI0039B55DC6